MCLGSTAGSVFGQTSAPPVTDAPAAGEPTHTIIPVHIDQGSGDIKVGLTTYRGAVNALHLLALKRQPNVDENGNPLPPAVVNDGVFNGQNSPDNVNQFLQNVLADTPDALLIANGVLNGYSISPGSIAANLEKFGGQVDLEGLPDAVNIVFVGNGGRRMGGALQRLFYTDSVDGYLATDSNGNYAFIQTDYVRYDITTDGTIKIGGKAYTAADSFRNGGCDVSNSIRLVVADRQTLKVTANNSYCTAQGDNQITYLIGDLKGVKSDETVLTFLGTAGHPIPANWNFGTDGDSRLYPFAQEIPYLGGYWETVAYLTPKDTFSLVGSGPPPDFVPDPRSRARESSSVYPGHPSGELHGILARVPRNDWYSPLNADTTGVANLDLYDQILARTVQQPEATFPALNSEQQSAFTSISQALCMQGGSDGHCPGDNVRNNYGNLNISISSYISQLQTISAPNGASCANGANAGLAFCQVWQQLWTELQDVSNIRSFAGNLSDLGKINGTNSVFDLLNTWKTVEATLPPPPAATAPSLVSPIVNLVLGLAGAAPTPLAPLFGLADTFFNFGESLTTDTSGNQTASLATPVANLATQAQNNFNGQLTTLGTQFNLIYQNWPKMDALGTALASGEGKWSWGTSTSSQISTQMMPTVKQSMYQSLMSAVYAIGRYFPNDNVWTPNWGQTPLWGQPSAYFVYDPNGPIPPSQTPDTQPFKTVPLWYSGFTYVPFTYPTDTSNQYANSPYTSTILSDNSWLGISLQSSPTDSGSSGHYDPPAGPLLSTLFTPVGKMSPEGQPGLGVYRPAFFEGWPFPRIQCTPTGGHGSPGGCNWNAAAPVLGAVPAPVTKLSLTVAGFSRTGTRVDVYMTVENSGTNSIASVQTNELGLRTLAGTGQAHLISASTVPDLAVPIPICFNTDGLQLCIGDNAKGSSKFTSGESTEIILTLDVPETVKKLELTEGGTAETIDSSTYQFGLGQVIFPQSSSSSGSAVQ